MLGYKQPPTEMAYKESSGHVTHVTDDVMWPWPQYAWSPISWKQCYLATIANY